MQICDYEYYKNKYYGNVIAEADFPRLIDRASTKLDVFTFNRLSVENSEIFVDITYATHVGHELLDVRYADKVRKCVCAIADYLADGETTHKTIRENGGAIVASVSSGSESISFRDASSMSTEAENKAIYGIVKDYLANTGLLYAGF